MAMHVCHTTTLCSDCMLYAVNGDLPDCRDERARQIVESSDRRLTPMDGHGQGFSSTPCGACRTRLAGDRFPFAILLPGAECSDSCPGPDGAQ